MKIKLVGFDPHNLLAFLALLGILKTLEASRPEWNPHISWIDNSPYLHLTYDVDRHEIAKEVTAGIMKIGKNMKFAPHKNLKIKPEEFDELQKNISEDIIIALGSDGILRKDKKHVAYPPLCMMLGSGHQNFLERLEDATSINENEYEERTKRVYNTLFNEWKYNDDTKIGFRWDPNEYRSHAYRASDPSDDNVTIEDGANRLAAIGFTVFWSVPTLKGLEVIGCVDLIGRDKKIIWPIWKRKMSLSGVLFIMRHPHMKKLLRNKENTADTRRIRMNMYEYGIECVMAADIFWAGKFRNVRFGSRIM